MPAAVMFCAEISVSMAVAWLAFAARTAVVKLKMLVNAGVVFCVPISTSHIGLKPSATVSFASALPSYMSHNTDQTVDSLHQQPKLPFGEPGGLVDGFV